MANETIQIDLEYEGVDDGGWLLEELEDMVAHAVNQFRERYPFVTVTINGVE